METEEKPEQPVDDGDETLFLAVDPVVWGFLGVCDLDHIATTGGPWAPAAALAVRARLLAPL